MKKLSAFLLSLALMLVMVPVVSAESTADSAPPLAIPTTGDVWDGSIEQPTKVVQKDGVYYYEIAKCSQLAYVAQTGGEWLAYNYQLQDNLILNAVEIRWDEDGNCLNSYNLNEWTPIGSFTGVFDGNGFTVSGLYINQPTKSNIGLFSIAGTDSLSATIKNLFVVNSYIIGDSYVGGFVGKYNIEWNDSKSIFTNCAFSGYVRAYGGYAGGLAGYSRGGYGFSNLINYGDICADHSAGGIISSAYRLEYCYNYGRVLYTAGESALGTAFGGIGGFGETYTYCINYGTVSGISKVGGIYGASGGGTHDPKRCENRGFVQGENCVGGIAGVSGEERISECKNSGVVIGTEYVGGIVGKRNTGYYYNSYVIKDVYNIGEVHGENYVGGIVGYAAENTNMSSSYNIGSVTATGIAGAILCSDSLMWGKCSANDCFYEKAKTPSLYGCGYSGVSEDVGGIAAKTADELKQKETYPQYDYSSNPSGWEIEGDWAKWKFGTYNDGYPYLSWESEKLSELTGIVIMTDSVSIRAGDSYFLNVQALPVTATLPELTWTSSDEIVATVNANGRVTAVGAGTATITVSSGGFSAACIVTVSARATEEYRLGELTVRDANGAALMAIPHGSFLVTIPITKLTAGGNSMVMIASYSASGQFKGLLYASVEDVPVGATVKITLPVDNSKGDIALLKAFTIASFSNPVPIGAAVSFPAQ